MATIIDRLVVMLTMDSKGYMGGRKAVNDADDRARKEAERRNKQAQVESAKLVDGFRKIRNEVLAIGGAYLGLSALRAFTTDVIAQDAAVGRLAHNLGMSTESLSRWEGAADMMGSSSGDIDNAFRTLVKLNEQFQLTGEVAPEVVTALARMGVNMGLWFNKSTTAEQRMLELSRVMHNMKPADAQLWGSKLGLSEATITMLMQGVAAVEKMRAAQKNVVTDEQSKRAQRMDQQIKEMEKSLRNMGRVLMYTILPYVLRVAQAFVRWVTDPKHVEMIRAAAEAVLRVVTDVASAFSKWVTNPDNIRYIKELIHTIYEDANRVADALGGWGNVLKGVAAVWVGSKLLPILTSMAAVLGTVVSGGGTLASILMGLAAPEVLVAIGAVSAAVMAIRSAYEYISNRNKEAKIRDILAGRVTTANADLVAEVRSKGYYIADNGDLRNKYDDAHPAAGMTEEQMRAAEQSAQAAGGVAPAGTTSVTNNTVQQTVAAKGTAKQPAQPAPRVSVNTPQQPAPRVSVITPQQPAPQVTVLAATQAANAKAVGELPAMAHNATTNNATTNTSNMQVTISNLSVVTQATDAWGVARDITSAITKNFNLASQANTGAR